MPETFAEALIRPALYRALQDRGGDPWSGTPSELLVMLAGYASDPLSLPVNARAFSVYLRKLSEGLSADGLEVIRWKSHGTRMVTIRSLPVAKCTACGSITYRLTSFHDRLAARWVCAWCDPSPRNPIVAFNVAAGPPPPGYWRSWARRPESASDSVGPPPDTPELPSDTDPLLVAIRDFVLRNAGTTYLGPVTWIGTASALFAQLKGKKVNAVLPASVEVLAKKLRKSLKELWALGVDLGYPLRGRSRVMYLQVIPSSDCRRCRSGMFWLNGRSWVCGHCTPPRDSMSVWMDRRLLKNLRQKHRDLHRLQEPSWDEEFEG